LWLKNRFKEHINIQTKKTVVVSYMNEIWQVSYVNWLKLNIDYVSKSCLILASCVDIFKGSMDEYVGSFLIFLDV